MAESGKTTVAVVGVGRIGTMHTQLLCSMANARVKTVVNKTEVNADWAHNLGISVVSQDLAALEDGEIEAVIIAASTDAHVELIQRCAAAKKHIFCEKPIAFTPDAVEQAVHATEEHGVKLQVGFNRRFDPHFSAIRRAVADGKIGNPYIVRITNRDPKRPDLDYIPTSGGLFLDFAVHDFDMARYATGEEIVEVYAGGGVLVDPEIGKRDDIDTAVITLKFASGAFGVIDCSRETNYGYDQRLEVFGSKGSVETRNIKEHEAQLTTSEGEIGERPRWSFVERYREAYAAQMRGFLDCVRQDTPPLVGGRDAMKAVSVAIAAGKSLAANAPIEV